MKRVLAILLISGLVSSAGATGLKPAFRVWSGFNLGRYSGQPIFVTIPEIGVDYDCKTGANFGIGIELSIPDSPLGFITEIDYIQKGQKELWYYWDELIDKYFYKLEVISQVGLLKIQPSKRIPFYGLAGYEVSLVMNHRYGPLRGWDSDYSDFTPDTKKVDFGLVLGGGVEKGIKSLKIFFEGRYQAGFINLSRYTGTLINYPEFRTRALVFCAGLKLWFF